MRGFPCEERRDSRLATRGDLMTGDVMLVDAGRLLG